MDKKLVNISVVIILAAFCIGAVVFFGQFFGMSRQSSKEKEDLLNENLLFDGKIQEKEDGKNNPIVSSISQSSAIIGDVIQIKGQNFNGLEGDLNAVIENKDGIRGIIYGESGSSANLIIFTLKSSYCQTDNSYSGLPCEKKLEIKKGDYKIYVMPWGKKSNEVILTIR